MRSSSLPIFEVEFSYLFRITFLGAISLLSPGLNPFLHLSMHLSISEQCSIDQPRGIRQAVELLSRRLDSLHDAHHATMECLGQMLWESQRSGRPPDGEAYIAAVQRRATSDGAKATGGA